jgi:uncharacterized integral membrane protein
MFFKKKGFVKNLFYLIIFLFAIILLLFLIKNKWDVNLAFENMKSVLRIK